MILESVIFFALLLATTLVIALLPPTMTARAWLGIPFCLLALAGAGAAFLAIEQDEPGLIILEIAAILLVCVMRIVQPRWSFVGAQLFVGVSAAALCYLVYASLQTFLGGLPILAVFASIALLILEILALGLSVSFTFEICDVLSRRTRQRVIPPLTREPWVALQVPTYNEPVEVVQPTLEVPGADRLSTSARPGRRQQHHRSRALEADRGTLCAAGGALPLCASRELAGIQGRGAQ